MCFLNRDMGFEGGLVQHLNLARNSVDTVDKDHDSIHTITCPNIYNGDSEAPLIGFHAAVLFACTDI